MHILVYLIGGFDIMNTLNKQTYKLRNKTMITLTAAQTEQLGYHKAWGYEISEEHARYVEVKNANGFRVQIYTNGDCKSLPPKA